MTRPPSTSDVQPGRGPAPARQRRRSPVMYVVLAAMATFAIGPIVLFAINSLKSQAELARAPFGLPSTLRWENYAQAWTQAAMDAGLRNSVVVVAGTVVGVCVISGCAAYAMARLHLPGSGPIMLYLLASSALPIQLFLVPLFYLWTRIGLYDTRLGLIVIYWAIFSPFATLLIRSFMIGIADEYEEAARLDGAGEIRILFSVVLPLAAPGFLTAALITALASYNEFLLALTFIQSDDKMPVSIAFFSFQQGYTQDYTLISAAGVIMLIPMMLCFLLLQRRFIAGYASSGLTG